MSWKIVRIAAPQYVLENEETGQAMTYDGRPAIFYSEEQALAAKRSMDETERSFDRGPSS